MLGTILATTILLSIHQTEAVQISSGFSLTRGESLDLPTNNTGIPAALVDAGLGDRLLFASDDAYDAQVETWWAVNARQRPYCMVLPHSTEEVSKALTALVNVNPGAGDWHIAVRSGGHSVTGNNIEYGVTIDLGMMNASSFDASTNIASLQPGGRWGKAYADLDEFGVVVTGGRDGDVGVGGLLLGGGYSFFSGHMGMACDSIINYEVVLANGTVVNANADENADLWLALKGGSGNFGIVTRFDMEAFPTRKLLYETLTLSSNYSDAVVDTVVDFANQDQSLASDSLITYLSHDTSIMPDIHALAIHVNTDGDNSTHTAFSNLKNLPSLQSGASYKTMAEAAADSQVAGGSKFLGSTITFYNDRDVVQFCVDVHKAYVETLSDIVGPDNFKTLMFLQPFPSYIGGISQTFGGNMLGLDNMESNAVIWTVLIAVDADEATFARAKLETSRMSESIRQYAESVQGDVDFIYLNYADVIQDPLGSYGAANVQHMREVAAKYDPTGVFQTRIPGGFKISRVGV